MTKPNKAIKCSITELHLTFHSIRKISSPADDNDGRIIYSGHFPITSVVDLPTHENVRGYLVEAEGKSRRSPTQVHMAIRETLKERPSVFSVLNSGIVIIASHSEVDEKTRTLCLKDPSIINGSQTQGEIRQYLKNNTGDGVYVKFELIITDDVDLIADISIARNFQNDVHLLSIAGRKGEFDELEEQSGLKLRKSESQIPSNSNDIVPTEKLLQVIAALLPETLWWKKGDCNKTYTYSAKATCLKDFRYIYDEATKENPDKKIKDVYQFYLQIAGQAWELYNHWKANQAFKGTALRSIQRDDSEIVDVPDGIIFPILASLSQFATKERGKWLIRQPTELKDSDLVQTAKTNYMEVAKSQPEIMGKSKACYSNLEQITKIYKRLLAK
jgi:hypothetical protein